MNVVSRTWGFEEGKFMWCNGHRKGSHGLGKVG